MKYCIIHNGSFKKMNIQTFESTNKDEILSHISRMIDNCIANNATHFSMWTVSDADPFNINNEGSTMTDIKEGLPSAEEYRKMSEKSIKNKEIYNQLDTPNILPNSMVLSNFSEPKYICPNCKVGGMRRDETKISISYPPQYEYECDNCHHRENQNI